jgi:hypothetical protein
MDVKHAGVICKGELHGCSHRVGIEEASVSGKG